MPSESLSMDELNRPPRHLRVVWCVCAVAVLLVSADTVDTKVDDSAAGSGDTTPPVVRLIRIPLPITGSVDERVMLSVDQSLDGLPDDGPRPLLVFEFLPRQGESGEGSQFERSLALARFLASERLSRARTVAYLPQSLQGHAVLVAMACEQIIMNPDAELGQAGIDETSIDSTIRSSYQEIADRRRTLPGPIALGMLDRRLHVIQVETAGGTHYVLEHELEELKQTTVVKSVETIIQAGELGQFTGRELRLKYGFVSRLASNRIELAQVLELPPSSMEQDPSLGGNWRPIQVELKGLVNTRSANRVQRAIQGSLQTQSINFICVWLDSPGGSPQDSLNLANFLAGQDSNQLRTVAYVPVEARADAALIALACDHIVMHEGAILGGAGAYEMDPDEVGDVRTTIRESLAKRKSRSWSLMAAIVDPELVVHEYKPPGSSLRQYFCDDELAEQVDPARWVKGPQITTGSKVLQVDGQRAREIGLASDLASNFEQFKQLYHLEDDPTLVEPGWAMDLIDALASPELAGLLLFIATFALWAEVMSPGIGLGGFISGICFLLFFWSQFLHGTTGWLEVLLFLAGVTCVVLEVFVIPGFGIFGLGGGALIILSLVLASQTFIQFPRNEYQFTRLRDSLLMVGASLAGLVAAMVVMRRIVETAPGVKRVMLAPPEGEQLELLQHRESLVELSHLVGRRGTTTTQLTPSGKAMFDGDLVDVISDGELIARATEVHVVQVHGNHVVVKPVE